MVHCKSTVKEKTHCKTHCKFCKKWNIIQCVTVNLQCTIVKLQCVYNVSHCKFTMYIFFFTMVLQCGHCKRTVKLYNGFYNGYTMVPLQNFRPAEVSSPTTTGTILKPFQIRFRFPKLYPFFVPNYVSFVSQFVSRIIFQNRP